MKYQIKLFREIINLESFETEVEADDRQQAILAAHARATAPENADLIREGSLTDASEWRLGVCRP